MRLLQTADKVYCKKHNSQNRQISLKLQPPLCKGRWVGETDSEGLSSYFIQSLSQKSKIFASSLYTREPFLCKMLKPVFGTRFVIKLTGAALCDSC